MARYERKFPDPSALVREVRARPAVVSEYPSPKFPDATLGGLAAVIVEIRELLNDCRKQSNGMKRAGMYNEVVPYDKKVRELEVELAIASLIECILVARVNSTGKGVSAGDPAAVLEGTFMRRWRVDARIAPGRFVRVSETISRPIQEIFDGGLRLMARFQAASSTS